MFTRNSSLKLKFLIAIIIAIIIILADHRFKSFSKVRIYMNTALSPLYFLVNKPRQILDQISVLLKSQKKLHSENQALQYQIMIKNSDLLILNQVKTENTCLRELLNSYPIPNEHKILTRVLSTSIDPYSNQMVIDKGSVNNVHEGQPVINAQGVVGQVIAVSKLTSRVLLICDISHALPVQVLRNGFLAIASGNGWGKDLHIEHFSDHIDIRCGDILVTSGIDDRFPAGYPVALVSSVVEDKNHSATIVFAHPLAELKYLRYLLLLSKKNSNDVR
ncbi:rod shape-determining protein MreC [Candidatus Erwinia haradaeae]|nr:rod shape-determining protein MreC [Candidatus Erwinia haradaeae]